MSHTLQLDDDEAGVVVEALRTYRETWQEGAVKSLTGDLQGFAATGLRRPGAHRGGARAAAGARRHVVTASASRSNASSIAAHEGANGGRRMR
jgi:hypothetical protein